jgi:hypothetical protein
MTTITGGCLCGAVRYSAEVDAPTATVCHCRDCQKFTGSAFGILFGVPQTALKLTGELQAYSSLGGSGKPIVRRFCPKCGSSVIEEVASLPGFEIINVGTLDDPTAVPPAREIFRQDALPSLRFDSDIPRFDKAPG